jgi:hypothetical protein
MLPESIHRGHQPVEAGVALHSDSQEASLPLGDASEITLSIPDPARNVVCQADEELTGRGETKRIALPLKKLDPVVLLHGSYLVRNGRLGKIQTSSRLGEDCPFRRGQRVFSSGAAQAQVTFHHKFHE